MKKIIRLVFLILLVYLGMNYLAARPALLPALTQGRTQTEPFGQARVVIGADLTEEQIGAVYRELGLQRGSVPELRLTNAEERSYLESAVDPSSIGSRTVSCVYLELLPGGSGLDIRTVNSAWTPEMYGSALATAGITDARVVVTAPVAVSGTGALAGVYKAYEDMTGYRLDDSAMRLGTEELSITGQLAEEIGKLDSASIVNELKLILSQTTEMSDEQLRQTIRQIAGQYRVTLSDRQVDQLVSLCRSLEGLDADALRSRVESVQETLQRMAEAKGKAESFLSDAGETVDKVWGIVESVMDLFH